MPNPRLQQIIALRNQHLALLKQEKALAFNSRPPCPYCGEKHVYAYGFNQINTPRYKCSHCKKSYSARTGTCFHYIHLRPVFDKYLVSMLSHGHRTLKDMCNEFGISLVTAFDWRHKILAALNCTPKQFNAFIELRNSSLYYCRKGIKSAKTRKKTNQISKTPVQLIISTDYSHNASIDIARIGKLRVTDIQARLNDRVSTNHIIISHYHKTIWQFAKAQNLALTQFSKKHNPHRLNDTESLGIDISLRKMVYHKARNVATKYLHHYSRWVMQTLSPDQKPDICSTIASLQTNTGAWVGYTNLEHTYMLFMQKHSDEMHMKSSNRVWKTAAFYK